MANYRVQILNRTYDVRIQDDLLEVNGDRVSIDVDSLDGKGLHVLRQSNRNIEAHVEPTQSGNYGVQIDGSYLNAEVALGFQSKPASTQTNSSNILAPMPGLIIDVLVRVGDQVNQGDTLVIQEAMKMQMKLRSPLDGVVGSILIEPNAQVEKGALLINLVPAA